MSIVPVDLNAFLYRAAKIIANSYHIIGNEKMVGFYLAYLHSTYLPLEVVFGTPQFYIF